MARAYVTVRLEPESELTDRSFVDRHGERVGWLEVGGGEEVGIYGAPDALLRLAAGLIAAADRAERLANDQSVPAAGLVVGAYGAGRVVAAS